MKIEKLLFSFLAAFLGLGFAFATFFLYQTHKALPQKEVLQATTLVHANPTPTPLIYLTVDSPTDEEVVNSKVVTVSGRTIPQATIVVITPTNQQIVTPTRTGTFTLSTTIGDDENQVEITAIAPNGEESKITRTISFTTQNF